MTTMTVMKPALALLTLALAAGAAQAETAQPYAGWQARPIKALSDAQIADLKAGRGMGFALAAELNGYPGPRHVLDLAGALALTDAQRTQAQTLFDAMLAETVPLGEQLIAREVALDHLFASRTVTPESLSAATDAIGATQAKLRAAHLKFHLATLDLLTPHQAGRYAELRGYAGATPAGQMPAGHTPGMHSQPQ